MKNTRRTFIKKTAMATAAAGALGFSAKSYGNIIGANGKVRVGVIGFSDRFRSSLLPCFMHHNKELNFDIVGVSDIWKVRREEGVALLSEKMGHEVIGYRNNDELFDSKSIDAVIISTPDFQHALHGAAAVKAGYDAYIEKPFAETMEDARFALKEIKASNKIIQ